MATAVLMPQVGQDITTAKIVEWLKKENDRVEKGDIIAVVESEKAAFDVEAYESGVLLKTLYAEGQEAEVLTPIAYIGKPGEEVEEAAAKSKAADEAKPTASAGKTTPVQVTEPGPGIAASPSARKFARERGINLATVAGTGPGGRITKKDVLAAVSGQTAAPEEAGQDDTVILFSPMRARIAQRLTHSKQNIPHFYISMDVDMSQALAWRQKHNDKVQAKVTITDMVTKAAAAALAEFPKINAHVQADRIILKKAINIGVAVSVEDGLIVPVITDANTKSIDEISSMSRQNAEAARAGRHKPQGPGTFTITNLGMYAVDTFVPIINPPECAILAVGAIAKKPVAVGEELAVREMMTMMLACDHRAVDGTYAAQFLERIKHYLENPASLEE